MLNENLDIEQLSRDYATARRLRVCNFFQPDAAERLYQCLRKEVPWSLAFKDGDRVVTLEKERVERMAPADKAALARKIHRQATVNFQFMYQTFALNKSEEKALYVHRLAANPFTDRFLKFTQSVTGQHEITEVTAHAARYMPGHFLAKHDDSYGDERRRIAYVLNFAKDWESGWGGLLHFYGERDTIVDTYVPAFNSLVLFNVPAVHSVSYVAPYALRSRYSVTGWFLV